MKVSIGQYVYALPAFLRLSGVYAIAACAAVVGLIVYSILLLIFMADDVFQFGKGNWE